MKPVKLFLILIGSAIMAFPAMAINAFASVGHGVPAAMLLANGNDLTVMGVNISSEIPREDIDGLYTLATGLLGKLGGGNTVTSLSPADLEGMGFTGDSLHSFAIANLAGFKRYLQITISPVTSPVAGYRIAIQMWDNAENKTGTYIEMPQELPLMDILGIMETGTHNMKVNITTDEAAKVSRMSFYYQNAPGAQEIYVASVEITALLMQTVLMSVMQ